MTDAREEALLPCPFCGGGADWAWHTGDALWIECGKCGAIGPQDENTIDSKSERTVALWNTRTLPTADTGAREEAVAALMAGVAHCERFGSSVVILDVRHARAALSTLPTGEALRDRIRVALSWIEPPFVDAETSADELRNRISFCLADADRALLTTKPAQGDR